MSGCYPYAVVPEEAKVLMREGGLDVMQEEQSYDVTSFRTVVTAHTDIKESLFFSPAFVSPGDKLFSRIMENV